MRFVSIIVLLLVMFVVSNAQPKSSTDVKIDCSKASAYITFESFVERPSSTGAPEKLVLLRLRNNIFWNLIVDTVGCRTIKEECGVFYSVFAKDGNKAPKSELQYCHVCAANAIPSGESVLFSVPARFLTEELFITVNFNYEWEAKTGGSGLLDTLHRVPFFGEMLPNPSPK